MGGHTCARAVCGEGRTAPPVFSLLNVLFGEVGGRGGEGTGLWGGAAGFWQSLPNLDMDQILTQAQSLREEVRARNLL